MENDSSVLTPKKHKHHHFDNHQQFDAIETISIDEDVVICYTDCGALHSCGRFCNKIAEHQPPHYCIVCHESF